VTNWKVSSVKYMRRVNLGNYEHEELTAEVVPNEVVTLVTVVESLKAQIIGLLSGTGTGDFAPVKEKTTVKEAASSEPDAQEPPTPTPVVEEPPKTRTRAPRQKVAETVPATPKDDSIVYNPSIAKHKDFLAKALEEAHPGWDSDENLPNAKEAAGKLANKPFLSATTGLVLDSFLQAFTSLYKGTVEKPQKKTL
jgi:hypothetical protein